MHSTMPSVISKSLSSWHVVSVGDTALLSLATASGAFARTSISFGDASAPADSHYGSWSTLLASSHRWHVSIVKGSMRSDSMFQCTREGGWRCIDILGPCSRL